jgi:hypothetical protein
MMGDGMYCFVSLDTVHVNKKRTSKGGGGFHGFLARIVTSHLYTVPLKFYIPFM